MWSVLLKTNSLLGKKHIIHNVSCNKTDVSGLKVLSLLNVFIVGWSSVSPLEDSTYPFESTFTAQC